VSFLYWFLDECVNGRKYLQMVSQMVANAVFYAVSTNKISSDRRVNVE
jgi:hypothetical protein